MPEPSANLISKTSPAVRVLVMAEPSSASAANALDRLGDEVAVETVEGAEACLERARALPADLVVAVQGDRPVGGAARGDAERVLAALGGEGPPVVVLTRHGGDAAALALYARGAADCVRIGPDLDDVLPVVALEHIRAYREQRERGRRERRLRWLRRLNEAIVGQLPAALAVLDPDRRVLTLNPEFTRLFGVDAAVARGRPVERVLPPELVHDVALPELLERAAAGQGVASRLGRMEGAGPGGSARSFDVRGQRLEGTGILLVLVDVTERERLTRRVRDLQGFAAGVIQSLNGALLATDRTGAITFANEPAAELLGREHEALRGGALGDWIEGGAAGRGEGSSWLVRTLRDGERVRGLESQVVRPDGRRVPVAVSCAPLLDAEGQRAGAVAVLQDLSGLKQLERHVLQTEKLASIGQLAAGVAHEINNPVGFVHANLFQIAEYANDLRRVWRHVDEMTRAVQDGDQERARAAAEAVRETAGEVDADFLLSDLAKAVRESQEGAERVRHIVQDLRAFSRQDSEERVEADLNRCLDSTAHIVWTMMKHAVRLEKDYAELPPLVCYPMQLKQVFLNLLVNAYQAIEAAGRSDRPGVIRLRTALEGDAVVVSVSDDGCGIPPDVENRIFDPFFTTKQVGEGTGLGLSTSYEIVRRHGGTIRVRTAPGEGSVFEVVLPRAGAAA